jgi:hypothetical protein
MAFALLASGQEVGELGLVKKDLSRDSVMLDLVLLDEPIQERSANAQNVAGFAGGQ